MAKVGPNAGNFAIAEMIGQLLKLTTHPIYNHQHYHPHQNHDVQHLGKARHNSINNNNRSVRAGVSGAGVKTCS